MNLLRNKEILRWTIFNLLALLLSFFTLIAIPATSAHWVLLGLASSLWCSTWYLLHWHYRQLQQLADSLAKLEGQNYSLDWLEYDEGELSILHVEISKITTRLREHSEALSREQKRLLSSLADISHQYKTPLTSMLLLVDLLQNEELPPQKRKEFLNSLQLQLERLEWLVTALLKLMKLDSGQPMKQDLVRFAPVVTQALEPLRIALELRGVRLNLAIDPEASFVGDAAWTAEAVTNLLKNAFEHTLTGGAITVATQQNRLYTSLSVNNGGPIIPHGDLAHIFERFYRGQNATENSVGIGLAIVRAVMLGQGGDVTVRSKAGEGTTFTLKFYHK